MTETAARIVLASRPVGEPDPCAGAKIDRFRLPCWPPLVVEAPGGGGSPRRTASSNYICFKIILATFASVLGIRLEAKALFERKSDEYSYSRPMGTARLLLDGLGGSL